MRSNLSANSGSIVTLLRTLACAGLLTVMAASAASASGVKLLRNGDVLSGQLMAMKTGHRKNRVITYQLTSEPRRLPAPAGLCNLETGPETFQIVTRSDAEVAALKPYLGKTVSLKASELSCADEAGQFSDAIVSKWSVVRQ
jgi:hypothetical protein